MVALASRALAHRNYFLFRACIKNASGFRELSNVTFGRVDEGPKGSRDRVNIGILGAPFFLGQTHQGLEKSPALLRQTGIIDKWKEIGHDVKDYGDVMPPKVDETAFKYEPLSLFQPANNVEYTKKLCYAVKRVIEDDRVVVTLGGDHAIGVGTIYGALLANPETCVLWVDAHGDINTPDTALTGHMHGMPLSFNLVQLAGLQPNWPNMNWFKPLLDTGRLAFIGLRDLDPLEKSIIDRLNITAYSMREVDELGIREVVARALDRINPGGQRPLHVSFDIDALDPLEAPATGTPVRGGLTLREGMTLLEDCSATGTMRGLDLVEVNVNLGDSGAANKTLLASKHLLMAAFGYYRGGCGPVPEELEKSKKHLP